MRFELKVVGTVLIFLAVAFSALNTVLFFSLIEEYESETIRYSRPIVDALTEGYEVDTPPHILISNERLADRWKEYDLITLYRGMFVYVKRGYFYDKAKSFMISTFLTEVLITLIITGTFYLLLSKFYRSEKRYRDLLGIILLASAHRMGNFLSSLKLSLEILKKESHGAKNEEKIKKLARQADLLEEDFKKNLKTLNSIMDKNVPNENISLLRTVREITFHYKKRYPDKLVYIKGRNKDEFQIKTNPALLQNLVDILIENAFMHSSRVIKLRLKNSRNKICLLITNDILDERSSGSGIGLEIARYLTKLLGAHIYQNARGKRFKTLITLPK